MVYQKVHGYEGSFFLTSSCSFSFSLFFHASCWDQIQGYNLLFPNATCHATPTLLRRCPFRFMTNQQTTIGIVVNEPVAAKNRAAYSACWWALPCKFNTMQYPANARKTGIKEKRKRCLKRSDTNAIILEKPQATAHGGMEYSCVLMAGQ